MNIQLWQGDCLELMKHIPDGGVDMILCDLPYGTTKNKWDSIINLDELWLSYERVIKKNGAIVLFGQTPFDKVLGASNLKLLKYEWVWRKNRATGRLNCNFAPMKDHENILVFSKSSASFVKDKSKSMNYNPQGLIDCNKINKRKAGSCLNYDTKHDVSENIATKTNYPKSVLEFKGDKGGLHPTQKPVSLLEYLIKTYTQEGETVLDNCMGSGSTGVACKNTNRSFIGIELDQNYFEIAKKRIQES